MHDTAEIRIRVDQDGVLANFAKAVLLKLGFHPDAPDADRNAMWREISADPEFWTALEEMDGR
jgi:hypothetical protein